MQRGGGEREALSPPPPPLRPFLDYFHGCPNGPVVTSVYGFFSPGDALRFPRFIVGAQPNKYSFDMA